MKITDFHLRLPAFLFVLMQLAAYGLHGNSGNTEEVVVLFTDRMVFITGEQINFSALILPGIDSDSMTASKILYCEIITSNSEKINKGKFIVKHNVATGYLPIPTETLTGIYYLRAYTKQMRNAGPESYAYQQIKIVNPASDKVLDENNYLIDDLGQNAVKAETTPHTGLSISLSKTSVSPRDSLRITLLSKEMSSNQLRFAVLSVIPENTVSFGNATLQPQKQPTDKMRYETETHGLTLSGKLTEASSSILAANRIVNLSVTGKGCDFMTSRTDSSGRFNFVLPDYIGYRDLFLCAGKTGINELKMWIDNDFCTQPVSLPAPAFSLTASERQTLFAMAQNVQVKAAFFTDTLKPEIPGFVTAFYSLPEMILYPEQYIELSTLEDYFNELPSLVKVRKQNGQKYFKISGTEDLSFFEPLVLVDLVAIDEPSRVLEISPKNVSRIEIVNRKYVKGEQTYGGIINVISKKGDYAGINLPSTGVFVNYQFTSENPYSGLEPQVIANHPDTRNTVFWVPDVKLKEQKALGYSFTLPDTPGKYIVLLQGLTGDDRLFRETATFEVKARN